MYLLLVLFSIFASPKNPKQTNKENNFIAQIFIAVTMNILSMFWILFYLEKTL